MKNLLLSGILMAAFTVSCSSVKNASTAQENRTEFHKMKGDWEITSIDYDKTYKVRPFDEGAEAQCFVGSIWRLIPNNNSGSYTLKGGGACPSVVMPIKFEVVGGKEFKFKKILEGSNAKSVTTGYSLNMINQTPDHFSLEQNIVLTAGQNVRVVYNFARTGIAL